MRRLGGRAAARLSPALLLAWGAAACGSNPSPTDLPLPAPQAQTQGRWELTWSEEFEKDGLPDPARWSYEEGFIRNREKQFYTRRPENARVENGVLVIEARKEKYGAADYTSASVTTEGKESWTYGRIEVRAKIPKGRGMWPAIWMLGTNIKQVGWPACGEIDIMENVGFDPDVIHGTVHTEAYNHVKGTARGDQIRVPAAADDFHVYAVEWFADHITFQVDGQAYYTFGNTGGSNAEWPFDKPQFLILNAAIGGDWGGQKGVDDAIFPQRYLIDYVRVYRWRT